MTRPKGKKAAAAAIPPPSTNLTEELLASMLGQLAIANTTDTSPTTVLTPAQTSPTSAIGGEGVSVRYLDSFAGFHPDHTAPLRKEIDRLAKIRGWKKERSLEEFTRACLEEFCFFLGRDADKLAAWQLICSDLKVQPVPNSVTQCKKALKGLHVNIYDYIDCKRACAEIRPVFTSITKFRWYSIKNNKIFPKAAAKQNKLLKVLLERVFFKGD